MTPEQLKDIEAQVIAAYPMPKNACRLTKRGIEGARNAMRKRLITQAEPSAVRLPRVDHTQVISSIPLMIREDSAIAS